MRVFGAPAAKERVDELDGDRNYSLSELRAHGIYADILTRSLKHGYLFRVERGVYARKVQAMTSPTPSHDDRLKELEAEGKARFVPLSEYGPLPVSLTYEPPPPPDLDALREAEAKARRGIYLDGNFAGNLSLYRIAVEARVRAECAQLDESFGLDKWPPADLQQRYEDGIQRFDAYEAEARATIARLEAENAALRENREVVVVELERVKAKHARIMEEVRLQNAASEFRDEIERSRAKGEQEPCELCPPEQIRRKAIHRVITKSTVHYWCSDHADEHYRHRLAALASLPAPGA